MSVAYGGVTVAAGGVTVEHDDDGRRRAHGPALPRDPRATSAWATARSPILTNDLTHAYVDENMGTS